MKKMKLIAAAIALIFPIGTMAATADGGVGAGVSIGAGADKESAGASGSAEATGSASGSLGTPEVKNDSAPGKAKAAAKKPAIGRGDPQDTSVMKEKADAGAEKKADN
jgi:hypothetical protein